MSWEVATSPALIAVDTFTWLLDERECLFNARLLSAWQRVWAAGLVSLYVMRVTSEYWTLSSGHSEKPGSTVIAAWPGIAGSMSRTLLPGVGEWLLILSKGD